MKASFISDYHWPPESSTQVLPGILNGRWWGYIFLWLIMCSKSSDYRSLKRADFPLMNAQCLDLRPRGYRPRSKADIGFWERTSSPRATHSRGLQGAAGTSPWGLVGFNVIHSNSSRCKGFVAEDDGEDSGPNVWSSSHPLLVSPIKLIRGSLTRLIRKPRRERWHDII